MLLKRLAAEGSLFAYAPPSLCTIEGEGDGGSAGGGGSSAGETRVELQTPITDERSAGRALEGLLDGDASGGAADSTTESDASASDAGPDESRATGDEEGHSEAQEGQSQPAPIEPPKSWPAEDQAEFRKLPPAMQSKIATRETERDNLLTQRTREIAEQRQATETERAAIATRDQQYQQSLQQLLHIALPEAEALSKVDWQKLAVEEPAKWAALSQQRESLRQRVGAVQAELQRVGQETAQRQQQQRDQILTEQRKLLVERVPEFGDPLKAKQLGDGLRTYLGDLGFSAEEIGQAADHRLIMLARDGMLYREAQAARKAAEGKRDNPAPKVQRPGSAQGAEDGAQKRFQSKVQQLGRSNSARDAASLLMDLL